MVTNKAVAEALGEGAARGVLEPLAKAVSAWVSKNIPQGSWLRSETGVSFVSGLGQFVEALASKTPFGRVSSDFVGDVLKSAFSNGGDKHRPTASEVAGAGRSWMEGFRKYAEAQIHRARPENLASLQERLLQEFEVKKAVWEKIHKEIAKLDYEESGSHETPTTPFDWGKALEELQELWGYADLAATVATGPTRKAANWLWNTPLAAAKQQRGFWSRVRGGMTWFVQVITLQQPSRAEQFRAWANPKRNERRRP